MSQNRCRLQKFVNRKQVAVRSSISLTLRLPMPFHQHVLDDAASDAISSTACPLMIRLQMCSAHGDLLWAGLDEIVVKIARLELPSRVYRHIVVSRTTISAPAAWINRKCCIFCNNTKRMDVLKRALLYVVQLCAIGGRMPDSCRWTSFLRPIDLLTTRSHPLLIFRCYNTIRLIKPNR